MIDGETNRKFARLELVEKISLTTDANPHSHPYYIRCVISCEKIKVTKITHQFLSICSFEDSAEFDIVPMQACYLLLGKSWIYTNNVSHDTVANRYSFEYNKRNIIIEPLTAAEILEADLERFERRKNEPF